MFWALLAAYAAARVLQVYRGGTPMLAVVALHVIPPALFALIHGARLYTWRGVLTPALFSVVAGTSSRTWASAPVFLSVLTTSPDSWAENPGGAHSIRSRVCGHGVSFRDAHLVDLGHSR